eukprot:360265-Chlamydomonas_euryale.AAC.2
MTPLGASPAAHRAARGARSTAPRLSGAPLPPRRPRALPATALQPRRRRRHAPPSRRAARRRPPWRAALRCLPRNASQIARPRR